MKANWKFLGLLTLLLSTVGVALALLMNQQYQKNLSLSVRPVPTELVVRLGQLPLLPPEQVGSLAVNYLQGGNLGPVDASSRYDALNQRVEVTLQSQDREALEGAGDPVVDQIQDGFQELYERNLGTGLETKLVELQVEAENDRAALERIGTEIEQETPPGGSSDAATARLEGLEVQRALLISEVASAEARVGDYERARDDLPRLAREAVSVSIASEPDAVRSGSPVFRISVAVVGGFLVALLATLVRAFFSGGK